MSKKAFAEDSYIVPEREIKVHDNGLIDFGIHDSGEGSLNDVVTAIGAKIISPQHGAQMRYIALSGMDAEVENISEKGIGGDINAVRGKHSKALIGGFELILAESIAPEVLEKRFPLWKGEPSNGEDSGS